MKKSCRTYFSIVFNNSYKDFAQRGGYWLIDFKMEGALENSVLLYIRLHGIRTQFGKFNILKTIFKCIAMAVL